MTVIKQKDIAKELGVSRSYISRVMSGKKKPSKRVVEKLRQINLSVNCESHPMASNPLRGIKSVLGGFDPHPLPPCFC
jgi:transcriptional regulator with XRE-family HTH domain